MKLMNDVTNHFEIPTEPEVVAISDWLVAQALAGTPIADVMQGLCERAETLGVSLIRVNLATSTLHPMFEAFSVTWDRDTGIREERYPHGQSETEMFLHSPYHLLLTTGQNELRIVIGADEAKHEFGIVRDLKERGGTDYFVATTRYSEKPVERRSHDGMVMSWATDRPGGFSPWQIAIIKRIQSRFAVAVKMATREQTATNVLSAYLGVEPANRVMEGQIRLGDFEAIPAVIWYSDLRQSTDMADRWPITAFIDALNAYFEATAGAVLAHGGEVLRFVGDAVLAIFPVRERGGRRMPRARRLPRLGMHGGEWKHSTGSESIVARNRWPSAWPCTKAM